MIVSEEHALGAVADVADGGWHAVAVFVESVDCAVVVVVENEEARVALCCVCLVLELYVADQALVQLAEQDIFVDHEC